MTTSKVVAHLSSRGIIVWLVWVLCTYVPDLAISAVEITLTVAALLVTLCVSRWYFRRWCRNLPRINPGEL